MIQGSIAIYKNQSVSLPSLLELFHVVRNNKDNSVRVRVSLICGMRVMADGLGAQGNWETYSFSYPSLCSLWTSGEILFCVQILSTERNLTCIE